MRRQLDGTAMTTDELFAITGSIGKIWKQYWRRAWPDGLKDTIASLLLELRWALPPLAGIDSSTNLDRTRSDIRGLAEFLAAVVTRKEVTTRSQSAPPAATACADGDCSAACSMQQVTATCEVRDSPAKQVAMAALEKCMKFRYRSSTGTLQGYIDDNFVAGASMDDKDYVQEQYAQHVLEPPLGYAQQLPEHRLGKVV